MKNLKYLQVVYKISEPVRHCLEEIPRRGGMYNWLFLFKGSMLPFHEVTKNILEQYDVVQVNLAPIDQFLVKEIKRMIPKSSSTLIIGNNDYTCESWDTWQQHPLQYEQMQEDCDAVFGTEPHQTSHLIDGAFTIPHPHWTKMLKHIGTDDLDLKQFKIGAMYHWWEGKTYSQSLVLWKLRKKYPKLFTRLYGYTKTYDKVQKWQKVMWDQIMPLTDYPEFQKSLMRSRFLFENCSYHTYGRTTVDCAALGVPAVGSDRVESMKRCFPDMCCDPFNLKDLLRIMDKILSDSEWLEKQMKFAYDAVEYYNYDNSRKRYESMVEEVGK